MGGNKVTAPRRQSNMELLRILAMVMIVAHHIAIHSDFVFPNSTVTWNKLWIQFIQLGGKVGVNLFVLISGYFGITAVSVKKDKLIKLFLQILTYSVLCCLVAMLFLNREIGVKTVFKSLLPVTYSKWWFASAYIVMYMLCPFINRLAKALDQKTYFKLLLLLAGIWSLIPTVLVSAYQSNALCWFVFLYLLAGYIRLYVDVNKIGQKGPFLVAGALIVLTYLSAVACDMAGTKIPAIAALATHLYGMEKLPVLLVSVCMFVGALNWKIRYRPAINLISSATFGVYLLHDHNYIRDFLWITLFKNNTYTESKLLVPYTILQVVIVYLGATAIELCRTYTLEKSYLKGIDKVLAFARKVMAKIKASAMVSKAK